MRWKLGRRSNNVLDARGRGSGMRLGGGGLSLGAVAAIVALSLITGQNPLQMLALFSGGGAPVTQETGAPPANDESAEFVRAVLGETENVWGAQLQNYQPPQLVLFRGRVQSGCGGASSATGPFYCPGDHRVYLDMSFFEQMQTRLGGGGDFAYAYVIAHEVGHHVQTLQGVSARVQAAGRGAIGDQGLLVRLELQADCYAGLWAHHAQAKLQWLEPGDIEEALATASAIGDDRLQKQAEGEVTPDSFTHGTSAQRVRWFKAGFEGGTVAGCDTFAASAL